MGDQPEGQVHKYVKKERGQYTAILTKQAWTIKDLLSGFTVNNVARVTGNPEQAR